MNLKWRLKLAAARIFSRPVMQPVNGILFRIAVSGMGVGNYDAAWSDEWRMLRKLRKHLPQKPVILDVGANIGQYSRIAREALPEARIYSFEPNPASFTKLQARSAELGVCVVPRGCGAAPGKMILFDSDEESGTGRATLVPGVFERMGLDPALIEVELTTIDQFCDEQGIDEVHLLKIDVEGSEKAVLQGASRMVSGERVQFIQFEFNEMDLLSHTTMEDIQALLPGYRLHRILYDGNLLPIDSLPAIRRNLFDYQNLVAVRAGRRAS
jgi:FkbM family methyltransferase